MNYSEGTILAGCVSNTGEFIIINIKEMKKFKSFKIMEENIKKLLQIDLKQIFKPIFFLGESGSKIMSYR